ncbi:Na/Pi cotransporter family protein [Phycisphaerales bacterium AB-hyl4]|uniref:Na/Pi cotransporter family protein n=1 Tax=Natronomicrosphaera hydrolytica TaxID=3242702 RepID=A0ABV4UB81_9BACT
MTLFITIAGGVALILYGVRSLRKGLDRLFGPQLGRWMRQLASSRMRSFFCGLGVSLAAPSSTTISVLSVQSVQLGHLSAQKMLAVMLGANIGLTLMVLLIALQFETYAPLLILIGVLGYQFSQRRNIRGIGQIILSLGFIFMAIGLIKHGSGMINPEGDLMAMLELAQNHPVLLASLAAILAVMLQSSTAAIGLVVGLAATGAVGLELAVPAVAGANVGLSCSTLLVGWGQTESRRLALGNLTAKVAITVLTLTLLPLVINLVGRIPTSLEMQVALWHTSFNLILAAIFLPLTGPVYRLTRQIIPPVPETAFGPRYITTKPVEGFSLATGQSMREILRISEIVRAMLTDTWKALVNRDEALALRVQERDNDVDLLDREIKRYLAQIGSQDGNEDGSSEVMRQLRYLSELEAIGDIIDKNLAELVLKRIRHRITFSDAGWNELNDFYKQVAHNMLIAETAFTTRDNDLARQLLQNKEQLSELERKLRDQHFHRLKTGEQLTHESSAVHLDLLTHLKRINHSVTHVAYAVLQFGAPGKDKSEEILTAEE